MIYIRDGEIRYDSEADLLDRSQLLEKISDILSRGYRAHCDALASQSNFSVVISVLSGEGVPAPGFRPDAPCYQDYCYAQLRGIQKSDLPRMAAEDLRGLLFDLVEREE